ncbi:type III secretion protein [Pseudomonas fluorescens]|uniref:Type III secretion protein n=1 Tax=Pseudomonas fluorescens TaxID=294 RepID=A0A944DDF3_PSEFL|nr:type III secretion protein [Pseudomonas fluorescens]MBT2305771.1 type III secretion protein [Pseudomonas fluorescens]MBT2314206.1 type III secretion protein [Pseudomonas fluorescens]MBT2319302.1 type III secretion protein [Pseudomonas fluorescens]MBT2327512.1 type III secretion protein [Pseudomonas fluorescens]
MAITALNLPAANQAEADLASRQPSWFDRPYAYVLVEQNVRDALEEFGHNLGLTVVISDKVRGPSRSRIRAESAGDFLEALCDFNSLTWYFDGHVLYLTAASETDTRLFKVQGRQMEQLQDYVISRDVYGKHISVRAGPDGNELFVSGPPAWLAMIEQHLDQQPASTPVAPGRPRGVRVFRGGAVTQE